MYKTLMMCLCVISAHAHGDEQDYGEKKGSRNSSAISEEESSQTPLATSENPDKTRTCNLFKQKFRIIHEEDELYRGTCLGATPEDRDWPSFSELKTFDVVKLVGCAPPSKGSYVAALRARNIAATDLQLLDLPADANLTAEALADVPPSLKLTSVSELVPAPGAINALHNIRSLYLRNVNLTAIPDRLPPNLDVLELHFTGLTSLPAEAFSVVKLSVNEERISSLWGTAPRLESLSVFSPAIALPQAPSLKFLWFLQEATDYLSDIKLSIYPALEILRVSGPRHTFPGRFLKGLTKLRHFTAVENGLHSVAEDLFKDTTKIYFIDLSKNNLRTLPRNLFSGLSYLEVLTLDHNQLTIRNVIGAIAPLRGLTQLRLKSNPIGDFCLDGGNSFFQLKDLKILDVSDNNLTRICPDWPRDMKKLRYLYVNNNQLRTIYCEELMVERELKLTIDLRSTTMGCAVCEDEVRYGAFKINLLRDSKCSMYR